MRQHQHLFLSIALCLGTLISVQAIHADPGGRANRTQKSTQAGCGGCHGSSATPAVVVTIAGPDTVVRGVAAEYVVTISGGPAVGSGIDIAARTGTLEAVSSTLKLSGSDLVQRSNTAMSGGSVTFRFNYSFNSAETTDTLYATGLSTNSNGGSSGDQWNWSPKKALVLVQTATDIREENFHASGYLLGQNYPNPFNPSTVIRYSLPVTGIVSVRIYDAGGRLAETLVDELLSPGAYERTWNASGFSSGVYYARLEVWTGGSGRSYSQTRKILLMK